MKGRLVILLLFSNLIHCVTQTDTTRRSISKVIFYSLLISTKDSIFVSVEIDRLKFQNGTGCEYCESSDISLSIKDNVNKTLYKSSFPVLFDSWDYLQPTSIYLEGLGNVLAINRSSFPSVGSDEGSIKIFGQDSSGHIIPMTDYIPMSGKFNDELLFKVHKINKSKTLKKVTDWCYECDYCLETCNFTGWCGFSVGQFYHISPNGIIDPKPIEFDTIPIYAGESNFIAIKELKEDINGRIIKLYPNPFGKSTPENVLLKINSKIKFFYILHMKNESVIYLQIDGEKGYIKDFNELDKMGFPACD